MIFEKRKNRGIESFSFFLAFIFLLIAVKLNADWLVSLDSMIQNITTIMTDSFLAKIFQFMAVLGSPGVVVGISLLIAIIFLVKKENVTALWITFTILGGDMIALIFKEIVRRPRPLHVIGGESGFSFPSGHVFGTTILVLIIIYIVGPRIKGYENRFVLTNIMWLWLLLMAISRVCLRAHFPSDVVGSILLATGWWKFAQILYLKFYGLAKDTIERIRLRLAK